MEKFQIIKLTLFPYDILVARKVSVDEIKKYLLKFGVELPEDIEDNLRGSSLAHTAKMPNKAILMYFPDKINNGLIAHETFHAVWMVLAIMGVEPSVESEEVYAYMIEYIINQIKK